MSSALAEPYPQDRAARDRWVLARRGERAVPDPQRPAGFFAESELAAGGEIVPVSTVLLTNRECPWRCAMCDLWQHTLPGTVPPGAIPAQLAHALARLPPARHIKLYNSGSFFDPRAIPPDDHAAIARQLGAFERVVVECHPAFLGDRCWTFRDRLAGQLEVAIGLETAHPEALERINKRMTLDDFSAAGRRLAQHGIALRVFLLTNPPFIAAGEAARWVERSIAFAIECGATAVSIIPTRPGNGALDALAAAGQWTPATLAALEAALDFGIGQRRARVFADLWDLSRLAECPHCFPARSERLRQMNLQQTILPRVPCAHCAA